MLEALGKSFGPTGFLHGLTGGFNRQLAQGVGYMGARGMGQATRAWAKSPTGIGTGVGTGVGGLYGAFSDDTSILGGMMGGAAMGGLGTAATLRYGVAGKSAFGMARGMNQTVWESAKLGLRGAGIKAKRDITNVGLDATRTFRGSMLAANRAARGTFLEAHVGGAVAAANNGARTVASTLKGWT